MAPVVRTARVASRYVAVAGSLPNESNAPCQSCQYHTLKARTHLTRKEDSYTNMPWFLGLPFRVYQQQL